MISVTTRTKDARDQERDRFLSIHATIHNSFDGRRLVISARTHRAFRFPAMPTEAMSLLRQEPSVPGDLLDALFSNVAVALHHFDK
ncbi:MAG: hypothetical protein DLM68_13280 [Hyphomicrobiales bacterium]|nr:MAG: hypothetical protein DLM68_13280 [Hyphomicrobiales bacterium]